MKKYIFMAVAGMLALSSCSNDDNDIQDVQNAPRQMTFTAGFGDGGVTRATLNDHSVSFDEGDQISILSSKNDNTVFTTSSGGSSATFTGTATDDSKFYAVYPYTDGLTLSGDVITGVKIPTDQWNSVWSEANLYSDDGWDSSAPIAYATTTDASLTFHNLCAILKIQLSGGHSGGVQISADQSLAGTFSLNTSTGVLSATSGSTTVTAGSWSDPSKFIAFYEKYIYIAIAPGEYTNFKVYVQGGGEKKEKTKSSVTFAAGKIYDLGLFNYLMD